MESAPETVHRKVLDSQHRGATALVTAEAQVPMITGTLLTSISLRAARTAASGLVWSSSTTVSICRPSTPPALLTSSITACMALSMRGPSCPPAPVNGVSTPNLSGSPCAKAPSGAAAMAAAAPLSTARRVVIGMGDPLSGKICKKYYTMSGSEKEPSDLWIGGQRLGGTGAAVLAIDQNVGPIRDGQSFIGILLDDGDGDPSLVDFDNGIEQPLGGERGQAGGRHIEEQQGRFHHQCHGHGEHLALAARQRPRRVALLAG